MARLKPCPFKTGLGMSFSAAWKAMLFQSNAAKRLFGKLPGGVLP
jgi:hypothetical protein